MIKKITSLALSAALFLGSGALSQDIADELFQTFTINAEAASTVVYNGDTMTEFSSRTAQSVAKKYTDAYYAGASYVDNDPSTYYSTPAAVEKAPYNQGVLTADTLKCMQEMTNFYRWLVGNKTLAADCKPNASLQYQALDRNFQFDHIISNDSKPADMPQSLWDKGFKCDHNVISIGFTPLGAIKGWVNEGYELYPQGSTTPKWTELGHRVSMLHPDHTDQQFGYSGNVGVGKADPSTSVSSYQPFYAFPSPGFVPSDCITAENCAWSVAPYKGKIVVKDQSKVKVTVTNLTTNESYTCTKENGKLKFEGNDFIGFVQPTDFNKKTMKYEANYKVVVTGLTDKATSNPAQIQYTVKFFDAKDHAASAVTKAGLNFNRLIIYNDTFDSTDSLKKLGACLPLYVTIANEFGNKAKVKTKGMWILDEANSCWYNSVEPSNIPVKFKDSKGILDRIEIKYTYSDDPNNQWNTLSLSPASPKEGAEVKFEVYTNYGYECSALCQIVKNDNGSYICRKTYSSLTSPEFKGVNEGSHLYYMNATPEDSGQYISIYYTLDDYWKDAYVCTSARTLTVNHSYEQISSKPATCTKNGEIKYKCSVCGKTYTETLPMLEHSYTGKIVDPTCTEQGYTLYTCSNCGDTLKGNYTPALGHILTSGTTVPATCTEDGYTIYTCTRCGEKVKANYVAATGHSWSEWKQTQQASCAQNGIKTRSCSVCGQTETEETPRFGHDYEMKADVAPTCTEQGYTPFVCKNCGDVKKTNLVDALGHSYSKWTQTKAPSCSAEGSEQRTCSRCKNIEIQPVPKLAHTLSATKTVPPTCTEQGYTLYTCSVCGESVQDKFVAAKGHSWGKWTTTTQPTCEKEGVQTRTCSVCGESETLPVETTEHKYTKKTVAPTCTEKGYTLYTCKVCGYTTKSNFVTENGHSWGKWITLEEATCQTEGTKKRTCSVCGESETMTTAKTQHKYVSKVVSPTCMEKGYTLHTCKICGDNYKDNYTDTTDHKFGKWITDEATPVHTGETYRLCTVCGEKQTEKTYEKISLRLAGSNRFDTALCIADRLRKENGGKAFENIIIASGMDFADALSATYLSKVKNAPILITAKADSTMNNVVDYIKKNADAKASIYIVGGEGAVPKEMEKKLRGYTVKRLAGANRYLTNIEVLKEANVTNENILVASGMDYADALSASAVGLPILLVAGKAKKLTKDQTDYLSTISSTKAIVIGGEGAVSKDISKQLKDSFKSVSRLGGANRFETSVLVAEKFFKDPPTIALAYGLNYPDGLCGGPLAMAYGCPLILTVSKNCTAAKEYAAKIKAASTVTFGGPTLITDDALKLILGK